MARTTRTATSRLLWALCVTVLAWPHAAAGYDIVNRWSATQWDGSGLERGDPVTLRWSIVPDGQSYSRSDNSHLIDFLDDGWGVPIRRRSPDLTSRAWWSVMDAAYAQYGRVSGITMVYVPEQNADGGDSGMVGDIRIGGEVIDDQPGGVLADNTFPNHGDMRIDTSRETDGGVPYWFREEAPLRNLVIHESGHGVGLGHTTPTGAKAVMESGLRTDIWGLQFDDVYALNRQYGDPLEKERGNDTSRTATVLGDFTTTGSVSIGTAATDSVVDQLDDDWVGIDGSNDNDWFRFSITGKTFADITLTPVGPSYSTAEQGAFNAAALNDLVLQFYSTSPALHLEATASRYGIGLAESIGARFLPAAGDYLVRVLGLEDVNQFYQLDLVLNELPLPGTSADLNLDGATDSDDWAIFVTHSSLNLSGYSALDAFQLGDLDHDGDNDDDDTQFFATAFDAVNGAGAFAHLMQVPEPTTLWMLVLAGLCVRMAPQSRRDQRSR